MIMEEEEEEENQQPKENEEGGEGTHLSLHTEGGVFVFVYLLMCDACIQDTRPTTRRRREETKQTTR